MKPIIQFSTLFIIFILAGCAPNDAPKLASTPEATVPRPSKTSPPEEIATSPSPETASLDSASIDVTYFTPSQAEGPYYTVDKPLDHDNDLTQFSGAKDSPDGEMIEFSGVVYDAAGNPIPNVVIEIWQTDSNGIYDHPGDSQTSLRDPNFQFYGEAVTAEDGAYSFRTILPGHYEPRPQHIHVKIKWFYGN
jgi:protocatechuate 3,4-dioxygenase beta subunit